MAKKHETPYRDLYQFKEGEIADPTTILLGYQIQINASVSQYSLTVIEKSRRIGATWGLAVEAVLTSSLDKSEGGMDTLYLGTSLDMAREFIDCCADWARALLQAAIAVDEFMFKDQRKAGGEDRDIMAFRIKFASGNEIVVLSSAPRSLRGRQGLVIIDEAAFHDDLPGVLKAAMALTIWGGKVVVISTHNGANNPYNELVNDVKQGRRKASNLIRIDFDDALRDGLYKRICEVKKQEWSLERQDEWRDEIASVYGDDVEEELYCVPKEGAGAYLSRALIQARMQDGIPVITWQMPNSFVEDPEHIRKAECKDFCEQYLKPLLEKLNPNLRSVFGQDFGRSGDLSVIWPLQIQPNMDRHTPFMVELRNIPFEQQKQVLFYVVDRLPKFSGGKLDARGNGQYLAEVAMQRYGSGYIEQVMLSTSWYRENMPQYKAAFEDGTILIPANDNVMEDHRKLVMENGVAKLPEKGARSKGTDGGQRHGDSAIAGALAFAASMMDPVAYEYQSANDQDDDDLPQDRGQSIAGSMNRIEGAW